MLASLFFKSLTNIKSEDYFFFQKEFVSQKKIF